ncbi:MIZ/SP-RING zinc finger-domain-containing protein [Gorgonomyces haynaldii]|nr:MIZ/SP-RING zinc finger-domain-containing protein [Gorgonomyces haynaldii]
MTTKDQLLRDLESSINRLRVPEIKVVLNEFRLSKAGLKNDLVSRLVQYGSTLGTAELQNLQKIVDENNHRMPRNFPYNRPQVPQFQTPQPLKIPQIPQKSFTAPVPKILKPNYFDPLFFYQYDSTLSGPTNMATTTYTFNLPLKPEHLEKLKQKTPLSLYQVMMMTTVKTTTICYPFGYEISVNSTTIPSKTFLGPQKKPWGDAPINLTPYLKQDSPFLPNYVTIKSTYVPGKKQKEDDDIVATKDLVHLKDPFVLTRLRTPVRSITCKHIQCFDAASFLDVNRKTPLWECFVCHSRIKPKSLRSDRYMKDILEQCDETVDSVEVLPDLTWNVVGKQAAEVVPLKQEGTLSQNRSCYYHFR